MTSAGTAAFWDRKWQEHLTARRALGLPVDIPRPAEYLPSITPREHEEQKKTRALDAFEHNFFAL